MIMIIINKPRGIARRRYISMTWGANETVEKVVHPADPFTPANSGSGIAIMRMRRGHSEESQPRVRSTARDKTGAFLQGKVRTATRVGAIARDENLARAIAPRLAAW